MSPLPLQRFAKLSGLVGMDDENTHKSANMGALEDLARAVILKSFAPDVVIVKQGDHAESCFLIVSGSCDVFRMRDPTRPNLKEQTVFPRKKVEPLALPVRQTQPKSMMSLIETLTKTIRVHKAIQVAETTQYRKRSSIRSIASVTSVMASAAAAATGGAGATATAAATAEQRSPKPADGDADGDSGTSEARPAGANLKKVVLSSIMARSMGLADVTPGCHIVDKTILGEFVVTMEEGELFGDLALIHASSCRAATVLANGRFDPVEGELCSAARDIMDAVEETLVVEIPKDST